MPGGRHPGARLARLLQVLWLHPGLCRAELAQALGLHPSTVTGLVDALLEQRLLAPAGAGARGRRAALALNPRHSCVGGVELQAEEQRLVLLDLGGRVRFREARASVNRGPRLLARLERSCARLERHALRLGLPLLGIGIGLPGLVDPARGVLLASHALEITEELALVAHLQPRLATPLHLVTDAQGAAWGELGERREPPASFLFLHGSGPPAVHGIGVGVVLNRKVRTGQGFVASAGHELPELARQVALLVQLLELDRVYLGGGLLRDRAGACAVLADAIRRSSRHPGASPCELRRATRGSLAVPYGAALMVLARAFGELGAPMPWLAALRG